MARPPPGDEKGRHTRPLRIVYWCQFFWPEAAAPARRLLDFGREWVGAGHAVTVVTGMPNHPTGKVPPAYQGRLAMTETKDGIRILRSWVYASPNEAGARKLVGHLSFALSSIVSAARLGRTDAVIASSPTFFMVFTAWLAARARRAPFVFEVRDLWPEIFIDLGVLQPGPVVTLLRRMSLFLYQRADLVVTVTESFQERIRDLGVPPDKVQVVTNGADVGWFSAAPESSAAQLRRELGLEHRFVVSYIGAHGVSHGLLAVMMAAERLRDRQDVSFLFVGDGAERKSLERYRGEHGLDNVLMLPQQPMERVRDFYALSDVCLVPLRDIPLFETFIPSKMFEVMSVGRPIIGSVRGEARRILEDSGAAVLTEPEDPDAIAAAVLDLQSSPERRAAMSMAGRRFVGERYSREALACRYAQLLAGVSR